MKKSFIYTFFFPPFFSSVLNYRKNVLDLVVSYLVADFKNNEHYQSSLIFMSYFTV